jgi:hypothetical protein
MILVGFLPLGVQRDDRVKIDNVVEDAFAE